MNRDDTYLRLNGIPCTSRPTSPEICFSFNERDGWRSTEDDRLYEIDEISVNIRHRLGEIICGGRDSYEALDAIAPDAVKFTGLNSESPFTREFLERLTQNFNGDQDINKLLYLYDCENLLSGIQEGTKEVANLQAEFYRSFNLDELNFPPRQELDGIRWISSPTVTRIIALLQMIFIRLHSLLDYTTKVIYEAENLRNDFSSYPRMASRNMQYGDRTRLACNGIAGTLFENCSDLTSIETIRHKIIHNGLLDDLPKIYKVVRGGEAIEKFILFPDMEPTGRLVTFKNRSLFYGGEDKINLRLPRIILSFQERQERTLGIALDRLRNT